tara:strand:- start:187 stop:402 length:216 start_codon:yes stop_codon:yes gene_type:complete
MPRNREFKFFKDDADETPIETIEQMSFKKAVKSIQNKIKDRKIIIEYISKKGKQIKEYVFLPMGRKKKLGR